MNFGSLETPDVKGTVSPPDSLEDLSEICGKNRGIQGHHNSCYLDATLFSMFYFTSVFDCILHRPKQKDDLDAYEEVRSVLKEGIVNPLRRFVSFRFLIHFVCQAFSFRIVIHKCQLLKCLIKLDMVLS